METGGSPARRIARAASSLKLFVIEFSGGGALVLEALGDAGSAHISMAEVAEAPDVSEAVCPVDWTWITGSLLVSFAESQGQVRLVLEPAGPLVVSALTWQGAPFLSFQPYKNPRGA